MCGSTSSTATTPNAASVEHHLGQGLQRDPQRDLGAAEPVAGIDRWRDGLGLQDAEAAGNIVDEKVRGAAEPDIRIAQIDVGRLELPFRAQLGDGFADRRLEPAASSHDLVVFVGKFDAALLGVHAQRGGIGMHAEQGADVDGGHILAAPAQAIPSDRRWDAARSWSKQSPLRRRNRGGDALACGMK